MEIEFELSMGDLVAFNRYHSEHSPTQRRARLAWRLSVPAIIAFGVVWNLNDLVPFLLGGGAIAVLWFALYPRFQRWSLERCVRKLYGEGKNKGTICGHKLSIAPDAISERTDVGQATTSWRRVEKITDADQHLFLYTGAVQAFIVPRRAFSDESEFRAFIETARRYREEAVAQMSATG